LVFKLRFVGLVAFAMVAALWPVTSQAATNPTLGNAAGFAVLAGTAASCTTSTITGGVGVNFNPPTTAGCNAQYAPGAYKAFQNVLTGTKPACVTTIGSTFPNATTNLAPGTYCTGAGLTFTDQTLNLTGTGSWNFEIGAGFTATNLSVLMANSGNPCNVFWWIGADATVTVNKPVSAPFQGTLLGAGAITLTGSASDRTALTLTGHVWATTAVTMTDSTIVGCNAAGTVGCSKTKGEDSSESGEAADSEGAKTACKPAKHCNQGVGNGPEGCDPGNSNQGDESRSNDELGGTPGDPGRQGGNKSTAMIGSVTSGVAAAATSGSHSSGIANVAAAAKTTSTAKPKGKSSLHADGKSKGKTK
jgi:hypothetical protein